MGSTASTTSRRSAPTQVNGGASTARSPVVDKPGPFAATACSRDQSGPTTTKDDEDQERRRAELRYRLRCKIRAIAAFRTSVKASEDATGGEHVDATVDGTSDTLRSLDILYHPGSNLEELRSFLWNKKRENEESWDNIQTEDKEVDVEEKYSIRNKKTEAEEESNSQRSSLVRREKKRPGQKVPDELRNPPPMIPVENDSNCDLCHQVAAFNVPCRICTRVYHRKCLEKSGRYRDSDMAFFARATTKEGWSCYNCDDLCQLLTAAETAEMMEDFDTYDINRDESISIVEFLRFKKRQYQNLDGRQMPEEEEDLIRAQFERMDTDNSGEVDWWEFMRFEARRYLARKSEEDIVSLMTEKEHLHAKDVYLAFLAGKEVDHSYFQGVFLGEGIETWKDFLHDQALYMVWSRPNREHVIIV